MTLRCKNCDQVILATDTACWHCGQELKPADTPEAVQAITAVMAAAQEAEAAKLSLTAVSVFAALTLATLLFLWLATQALARYPLIQLDPQAPVKPGWTTFADHRRKFMLDLPPRWTWLEDEAGAKLAALLATLSEQPQFAAALAPLAWEAGDTEVRLLARAAAQAEESVPGFLVVGESADLNRFTATQLQALLTRGADNVQVGETAVSQDLHGNDMVTAVTQFTANSQPWRCQQRLIHSQNSYFIVAVCQPEDDAPDQAATNILGSFQLFDPPN